MSVEDELTIVTLKIYLYLVKTSTPVGPRDVMHGAELNSPAVAHRGLTKLVELNLVQKDEYGRYSVKEKTNFKGHVWLGKNLVPRLLLYGFVFIGLLIMEVVVLYIRWSLQESIEPYGLLTAITAFSAFVFITEGLRLRRRTITKTLF